MPSFNPSPFAAPPVQLMAGVTEYLLGRHSQYVADTKMAITGVVDNGTIAVFSGQIFEGNIPTVGSLFSAIVSGTAYNAVNRVISAVSFNANGLGTVSVPTMATGTVAVIGTAIIPVPETPETLVAGASIPCMLPLTGTPTVLRALFAECTFPTLPTAATVTLQSAMRNIDSEYTNIGTVGTVAGGAATASQFYIQEQGMYYRAFVSGLTGAGTVVFKLVV